EPLAVKESEIKAQFKHEPYFKFLGIGIGSTRFTRSQHQEDLKKVRDLFHKHGYPAVRVQSSINDPEAMRTSFDRKTRCVNATISIEQRRRVDIRFDGSRSSVSDGQLLEKLTFNDAGATDDVEAAASARAIA